MPRVQTKSVNSVQQRAPHVLYLKVMVIMVIMLCVMGNAFAQQQSGCFAGRDHFGSPAKAMVNLERYGDWFQITGQIHSSGTNTLYQFSVDGHSGSGRLYQRHEYESDAVYMDIISLTEQVFVFEIEGYGRFVFRRVRC